MGFFKDFKDDFSQALNELLPGDDFTEEEDIQVNTLDNELDVEQELSKLDGLLEQVEKKTSQPVHVSVEPEPELPPLDEVEEELMEEPAAVTTAEPEKEMEILSETQVLTEGETKADVKPEPEAEVEPVIEHEPIIEPKAETEHKVEVKPAVEPQVESELTAEPEPIVQPTPAVQPEPEVKAEPEHHFNTEEKIDTMEEEKIMDTIDTTVTAAAEAAAEVTEETAAPVAANNEVTDEVSVITAGTSIKGNMETTGSFEIEGRIEGDIKCNGKLTVIGSVVVNSASSEFFADAAHIEGEVVSSGTVKVGLGSVIIGNITATSAVIAGAVKGDIDVQGPVVVDTSAVIMGNIKSRSVQINNGAVIEGFCSQCYSDVDVESLFAKNK